MKQFFTTIVLSIVVGTVTINAQGASSVKPQGSPFFSRNYELSVSKTGESQCEDVIFFMLDPIGFMESNRKKGFTLTLGEIMFSGKNISDSQVFKIRYAYLKLYAQAYDGISIQEVLTRFQEAEIGPDSFLKGEQFIGLILDDGSYAQADFRGNNHDEWFLWYKGKKFASCNCGNPVNPNPNSNPSVAPPFITKRDTNPDKKVEDEDGEVTEKKSELPLEVNINIYNNNVGGVSKPDMALKDESWRNEHYCDAHCVHNSQPEYCGHRQPQRGCRGGCIQPDLNYYGMQDEMMYVDNRPVTRNDYQLAMDNRAVDIAQVREQLAYQSFSGMRNYGYSRQSRYIQMDPYAMQEQQWMQVRPNFWQTPGGEVVKFVGKTAAGVLVFMLVKKGINGLFDGGGKSSNNFMPTSNDGDGGFGGNGGGDGHLWGD